VVAAVIRLPSAVSVGVGVVKIAFPVIAVLI
jgi:hypothetical protein